MLNFLKAKARVFYNQYFKLGHRREGYRFLSGRGLEIGALYLPALLPKTCIVKYADALSCEEVRGRFPELKHYPLVDIDYIIDLDKAGLLQVETETLDFVVMNHVLEHVANPIHVLRELFRVVKKGGHVVLTIPDVNFTIERNRPLTSFEHIKEEFDQGISEVSDAHYEEFIKAVNPDAAKLSPQEQERILRDTRSRREHAHAWSSLSFENFILKSCELLNQRYAKIYASRAIRRRSEYFAVYQKLPERTPT